MLAINQSQKFFPPFERLSQREIKVLRCVARGFDFAEIAKKLGLSPHTVRHYADNARGKLFASTLAQAVTIAIALGYFDADEFTPNFSPLVDLPQ